MQKKPKKTRYELLKECVEDFVANSEQINDEKLIIAERELQFAQQESIAFNLLRQNIYNLEQDGISED